MKTLVISANINYKNNLANSNYFLEAHDNGCKHDFLRECLGGIDRRKGGVWEVGICIDNFLGGDEEDPDCWTDYLIVAQTPDLLQAKVLLKEAARLHFGLA